MPFASTSAAKREFACKTLELHCQCHFWWSRKSIPMDFVSCVYGTGLILLTLRGIILWCLRWRNSPWRELKVKYGKFFFHCFWTMWNSPRCENGKAPRIHQHQSMKIRSDFWLSHIRWRYVTGFLAYFFAICITVFHVTSCRSFVCVMKTLSLAATKLAMQW
jgi:hypothetical protein